jgi:hypothetical protein
MRFNHYKDSSTPLYFGFLLPLRPISSRLSPLSLVLTVLCGLILLPGTAKGQADSITPRIQASFKIPGLAIVSPLPLRMPSGRPGRRLGIDWDSAFSASVDSARATQAMAFRFRSIYGEAGQTTPRTPTEGPRRGVLGLPSKYADLTIDGTARVEIRSDRVRNERCTPAALLDPASGCRGGFTAPRIDNQFNVLAGGLIGRRLHVNVDYDSERDFGGNDNIQVYYQGLEDEIVQRVEVGTVTFRPPASRFITAAVPANNFGVNATFEIGPFQVQTIAAQQKGSSVAERVFTVGERITQPQDRQVRDLDFESGRFFWVVDPAILPGFPALDILNVSADAAPPAQRPQSALRVYRYRAALSQGGINPNVGGINAVAISADGAQRQTARWELMIQNQDYYLDGSGLWFTLASKLDQKDFLAVSYVTATGVEVGTGPVTDTPVPPNSAPRDTLRLIVDPLVSSDRITFRHEMRQVYRVAGSDLDRNTLLVDLSVNQTERPLSGAASTYLALLGLSRPTDESIFDAYSRLFPRIQDTQADQTVRESYIVFPHLEPFADATRLQPAELSDSLYRTPLYLLLSQGPPAKFLFRLRYSASGNEDRSGLDLNALQIRDGSEQISANGRVLERGVDYSIDYNTGRVTFLNPDALFGGTPASVTARFEEQGFFAVAPTTILGASTQYRMGDRGNINLIGIYQYEQTAFNRPPLGFEPEATLVAGLNTDLHFRPNGITRFLSGLTSGGASAPSRFDITAELAVTKPDPNRAGAAFLEEFEAEAGIDISMRENLWGLGSRPQDPAGLVSEIPDFVSGFDSTWAVQLTWQNLVPACRGCGPIQLRAEDIDPNVTIVGTGSQRETIMFTTLHADTAGGIVNNQNESAWTQPRTDFLPRWRSMVTALSTTGTDLTRNEYLEFWVFQDGKRTADSAGVRLVLDLGSVNEDALAVVPESVTVDGFGDSTFTGRAYTGVNQLDTERDPTGIFNAALDDIGILADRPDSLIFGADAVVRDVPLCTRVLSQNVPIFPWGDLSARCTNGNGVLDTEDLNADLTLNAKGTAENVFRYVVTLGGPKYFVRDGVRTVDENTGLVSVWKLYRIPLREPDATIGAPNMRLIQHLRLTVAAENDNGAGDIVARFGLARMKLIGSQWVRRADRPIKGLSGSLAESHGAIISSIVSTVNTELGYASPPGLGDQASRKDGGRDLQGLQINEKSLRVLGQDLLQGERAEAYLRFPSGPQNLLKYNTLRFWARGRGQGWEDGQLEAFLKLGSDDRNFYMYRASSRTTTWEPELAVDLETWRRLRGEIQSRYLQGLPPSGSVQCGAGDSTAYVACDGPYFVQVADPGINPPNLAKVQELSAGIYRLEQTTPIDTAELWIDDIRLTEPVSQLGSAIAVSSRLTASDVADFSLSYIRQDGSFQQIGSDPTYRTTGAMLFSSAVRMERFLPRSLGVTVPVTVSYGRNSVNPDLLQGSDLRASDLTNLRKPESWTATYNIAVQRSRRGTHWLTKGFIDPVSLNGNVVKGRGQTELSETRTFASAYNLTYNLLLGRSGPFLNLGGLVNLLPGFIRNSEAGQGLRRPQVSLFPSNVRFSSGLTKAESDVLAFPVQVERPQDANLAPIQNLTHLWRNTASLNWQPFGMLQLGGDLMSTRDLREYSDSTSLGRLAHQSRRSFAGLDVGVERDRQLGTSLSLNPRFSSWLRPRFSTGSSFVLSRTLTSRPLVRENGDSTGAFILPQTLNNSRSREIAAVLDLSRGLAKIFGDSSRIGQAVRRVRPLEVSNRLVRSSTYDLAAFDPGLGYMLGLGGREDFLTQEGQGALSLNETRTNSLSSGAELPFGISFNLSYSRVTVARLQQVSGAYLSTDSRQREWPVGSMRFTQNIKSGPVSLITAGLGFRRREGSTLQPGVGGNARTATFSSSLTPDLQLGLRNGMVLLLGYNSNSQRNENNGNTTESDQNDLTGTFSYVFRLPGSISRLRKQVSASLITILSSGVTCLTRSDQLGCQTISDTRRTELRGSLDTDLLKLMRGGIQFGYSLSDARHLNRRISTIYFAITMQLSLYAGDYR